MSGVVRNCHGTSGDATICQELSGVVRSCHGSSGGAKRCKELSEGFRCLQENLPV